MKRYWRHCGEKPILNGRKYEEEIGTPHTLGSKPNGVPHLTRPPVFYFILQATV
jgi:hypothetical protein